MMQPGATAVADSTAREGEIFQEFEQRIGSRSFNLWVRDNASIEIVDDQVTINVHNNFLLNWLQQRHRPALTQSVQLVLGAAAEIRFRVLAVAPAEVTPAEATIVPPPSTATQCHASPQTAHRPQPRQQPSQYSASQHPSDQLGLFRSRDNVKQPARRPSPLVAVPFSAIAQYAVQQQNSADRREGRATPGDKPPGGNEGVRAPGARTAGGARSVGSNGGCVPPAKPPGGSVPSGSHPPNGPLPSGRRFADLCDFVAGPGNQLAFAAALQVCEQPGVYSPLVLHGGVGIGKTHLLEGIYRRMRVLNPSLRVMFLSAESFANYFTQALRDRTLASFRQRFRGVDVLMIDDIDFLDGKRVIQEEFLHTIKQLETHQRQVALTADRHPRLLAESSEELVTRFMSGIVCRLESPDVDTRRTIVARKVSRLSSRFTDDAIEFVVQRFALSVREMEGALNCLETYGLMTGKALTLAIARHVLADLERDCVRIVRVAEVEQAVCRLFSIGTADLRSPRRNRSVSQPRMLAMYLARKMTQAAYTEIGEHFGGRNHSTVMSAEKRVRDLLASNATVRAGNQEWKLGDLVASLEQQLLTG
jgi:chromosomal replication initiator protein